MEKPYKFSVNQIIIVILGLMAGWHAGAQTPAAFERFIKKPALRGASVSLMVKEIGEGRVVYSYEPDRQLTPASVMKTVTTATALEILGENFRFETSIMYDGTIREGILYGNLYICGSGDPTLNSSFIEMPRDSIIALWANAVERAGIRRINGRIIADERIFDTEGVSMKWMREDLGSDYGQGSYGLNIFDNHFKLFLEADTNLTQPIVMYSEPSLPQLKIYNNLVFRRSKKDSCLITGFPYQNERYLYGVVAFRNHSFRIAGDIPEPALFTAYYVHHYLQNKGVMILDEPTSYRILSESEYQDTTVRKTLITTYSMPLKEIVRITNFVSHNLYADVLIKTLGLRCVAADDEALSSFDKGVRVVKDYWNAKGLDTEPLWMFDGSGLAITDKVTTRFLCDLYTYMATRSSVAEAFFQSLPRAGKEGTVRSLFRGSALENRAKMKSGSMSRVQCYGGYVTKDEKQYAFALIINSFTGKNNYIRAAIEELFLALF